MDGDRKPWERLEDETDKAYKAFECYRDLEQTERSQWRAWVEYAGWRWGEERRAEEEAKGAEARQSGSRLPIPGMIGGWSAQHEWVRRARAWDNHLARVRQRKREREHAEALDDHRDRQERFARASMGTAIKLMRRLTKRIDALTDKDLSDPRVLAKLIRANIDLFQAATNAEAQALAVDEILMILDEQGKLQNG